MARWRQIEKRDARLLVPIPRLENDTECRHRCRDQLAGIGRRHRQSRQRTPPPAGSLFARRLATLASVFVGAIPTETGEAATRRGIDARRIWLLHPRRRVWTRR